MDCRRGASFGVVGSWNAVCGVNLATLPFSMESKLYIFCQPTSLIISTPNAPFDEHNIIRSHPTNVFPFVIWVMLDGKRLALTVREDERDGEEIILGVDAPKITERERPLYRRNGYRSPQIDYLETALQERWRFVGRKVAMDPGDGCRSGLVNVSLLDRLSLIGAGVTQTRLVTANG